MALQNSKTIMPTTPSSLLPAAPNQFCQSISAAIQTMQGQYRNLYRTYLDAYNYIYANPQGLTAAAAYQSLGIQGADWDNFVLGILEFFLTYQSVVLPWNPAGSTVVHNADGSVGCLASGGTSSGTPE